MKQQHVKIGKFEFTPSATFSDDPISLPLQFKFGQGRSSTYFHEVWSLDHIQDLIDSGYSASDIIAFVKCYKYACTSCLSIGHTEDGCTSGHRCVCCLKMGHIKRNCSALNINQGLRSKHAVSVPGKSMKIWVAKNPKFFCIRCLTEGHLSSTCCAKPRCQFCWRYGHSVTGCKSAQQTPKSWRVKISTNNNSQQPSTISESVVSSLVLAPSKLASVDRITIMANYPCNPFAFVPTGLAIDNGLQGRRIRCDLALSAMPPLNHDNYAVAETNQMVPIQQRYHARRELRRMLDHDGFQVSGLEDYPIGLGLFSFATMFARDLVVGRTFTIDDWIMVTFVKHDEALNMRPATLGQERWVMFLNFPLDYQSEYWVEKAVSLFGKLIVWHNPTSSHARVLVKVWVMSNALIPKSLVLRQFGGQRYSWTVPVYPLRSDEWNAHIHEIPLDSEDPPPADGNPHPMFGPHVTAEQRFQQRVELWLQQNGMINGGNGGGQQDSDSTQSQLSASAPVLLLPARGQVNYQAILREQGVHFAAGIHPPRNGLSDSPLSAWNDMISDTGSSSESLQIIGPVNAAVNNTNNTATDNNQEVDSSVFIARILLNMQQPNIHIAAKCLLVPFAPPLSLIKTFLSDNITSSTITISGSERRVARKLCFDATPNSDGSIGYASEASDKTVNLTVTAATPAKGRKKRNVPTVVSEVRRSPRFLSATGNKIEMPTDSRKRKSKVKSRIVPDAGSSSVQGQVERMHRHQLCLHRLQYQCCRR